MQKNLSLILPGCQCTEIMDVFHINVNLLQLLICQIICRPPQIGVVCRASIYSNWCCLQLHWTMTLSIMFMMTVSEWWLAGWLQEAEQCGSETALRWNCAFAKTHVTRCRQSVSLTAADKLRSLHVVKQLLDGLSSTTASSVHTHTHKGDLSNYTT